MTTTTARPEPDHDQLGAGEVIDLPAHEAVRTVCPEECDRVLATAADLVVQGRRVTVRLLASLTGIEPVTVESAVHQLVRTGHLHPAGAAPHHYVFPPGRWPVAL